MRSEFQVHTYAAGKRRRKPATRAAQASTLRVQEAVWTAAMRLAAGDHLRINVISATEVVVHNSRRRNR